MRPRCIKCLFKFAFRLMQDVDVFTRADIFEDLWPHRYAHLTQVGLAQQVHIGPGLSDATPDAQWNLIVENGLMVREAEKIFLAGQFKLNRKCFPGDPYAHRRQLVTSLCHRIPYQDITI